VAEQAAQHLHPLFPGPGSVVSPSENNALILIEFIDMI